MESALLLRVLSRRSVCVMLSDTGAIVQAELQTPLTPRSHTNAQIITPTDGVGPHKGPRRRTAGRPAGGGGGGGGGEPVEPAKGKEGGGGGGEEGRGAYRQNAWVERVVGGWVRWGTRYFVCRGGVTG